MIEADAVVVGEGPVGATAALNPASFRRVLLLARRPERSPGAVGESLPATVQGLFNTLHTGLAGAEAADRAFDGDALAGYAVGLDPIWHSYARWLAGVHARERRWRDAPSWNRRVDCAPSRTGAAHAA